MSLFADGNEMSRKIATGFYRAAMLLLMAIVGYFLRDLHESVKSTGRHVGMVEIQIAVLKAQIDVEFTDTQRRLDRLERGLDFNPGEERRP